jgi:hypothetical protein
MPAGVTAISRSQMAIMVKYAMESQGNDFNEMGDVSLQLWFVCVALLTRLGFVRSACGTQQTEWRVVIDIFY